MADVEYKRPPLNGIKDEDNLGQEKIVSTLQEYYAEDYPVITPRIIKMINLSIGYAKNLNGDSVK